MSSKPAAARRLLSELQPGTQVEDAVFLIAQKDLRTTTGGGLYIHAVLADRSGQMLARMWNASQTIYESMPESGPMRIRGRVESYKGKPQFIIDGVRAVDPGEIDPKDFLPHTAHDVEQMWARTLEILRKIKHPDLLAIVAAFIHDKEFASRFKEAPAARTNHHAFIGGLLEHTLALLELAVIILPRYPRVSSDLVLTGIFLHDAGKTAELGFATSFNYTTDGQLLGHIVQVSLWVQEKVRQIEAQAQRPLSRDVVTALLHIIVAHHGKYEFGSPKLPATAEAIMVHHLDNLDAKLNMLFGAIDADPDVTSEWTAWVNALETKVYKVDPTRSV